MLQILCLHYLGLTPFVDVEDSVFGIVLDRIDEARVSSHLKGLPSWLVKGLTYLLAGNNIYSVIFIQEGIIL